MEHLNSYADDRLVVGCIYCHGDTDTREHVPSRIPLDEPYPENLPVLPACSKCNQGFSLDEEYFACLIECARTGGIDRVERPKIRRILQESLCSDRISDLRSAYLPPGRKRVRLCANGACDFPHFNSPRQQRIRYQRAVAAPGNGFSAHNRTPLRLRKAY